MAVYACGFIFKRLYFYYLLSISSSSNIPAVVLSLLCAEGDNGHDGIMLASYLNQWKQWIQLKVTKHAC